MTAIFRQVHTGDLDHFFNFSYTCVQLAEPESQSKKESRTFLGKLELKLKAERHFEN